MFPLEAVRPGFQAFHSLFQVVHALTSSRCRSSARRGLLLAHVGREDRSRQGPLLGTLRLLPGRSERPPNNGRRPWPSVDVRKDAQSRDEHAGQLLTLIPSLSKINAWKRFRATSCVDISKRWSCPRWSGARRTAWRSCTAWTKPVAGCCGSRKGRCIRRCIGWKRLAAVAGL